jgi:repressor LexA
LITQLTERQEEIFQYIYEHINENHYPPTLREIADHFKFSSTNAVNDHLVALERKGYLRRGADKSRALEILKMPKNYKQGSSEKNISKKNLIQLSDFREIPIVGRIAAGKPLLATENIESTLKVDSSMFRYQDLFAVKVKGDSMVEDHILNGDIVVIKKQAIASASDIVAALLNDEVTLKRFYHHGDKIELRPANVHYESIFVHPGEVEVSILGKMVGLIRKP